MGIADIKSSAKAGAAKKPKRYPDGVYVGEALSVTAATYELEGAEKPGKKLVINYSFAPKDPQQFLGLVPFDRPTAKFEILLPDDAPVFVALFGDRDKLGNLIGGYHQWTGDPAKIPSGQVELTIKGTDGGKKKDGTGYWDPSYKIVDINPIGTADSAMRGLLDDIFSSIPKGESEEPKGDEPKKEGEEPNKEENKEEPKKEDEPKKENEEPKKEGEDKGKKKKT